MRKTIFSRALALFLCLLLLPTNQPARASNGLQNLGRDIALGVVGIAAGLVVTVVLVVHYMPKSAKGCVASGPNGLQLADNADKLTYELTGDTSNIKAGEVVKVKGKKKHGKHGASSTFTVTKLSKDYGACPANPSP